MRENNQLTPKSSGIFQNLPNPVIISRQIDGLKEVMRRMQASHSDSFDSLIAKKLEKITQA